MNSTNDVTLYQQCLCEKNYVQDRESLVFEHNEGI